MISLKDYANAKGVTYEAVRRQVSRYREELGEHIQKKGKVQFLDKEAVAFLDTKRAENPVVLAEQNKTDEMRRLQEENAALKIRIEDLEKEVKELEKALEEEKNKTWFGKMIGK